jgi:hypothetical protein
VLFLYPLKLLLVPLQYLLLLQRQLLELPLRFGVVLMLKRRDLLIQGLVLALELDNLLRVIKLQVRNAFLQLLNPVELRLISRFQFVKAAG